MTRGRHGGNNHEYRFTQKIRIMCPEDRHRLGSVDARAGDLLALENGSGHVAIWGNMLRGSQGRHVQPDVKLLYEQENMLVAVCPACNRAGLRKAKRPTMLRISDFNALLAAQHSYGPAAITVAFNKGSLRAALRALIPDGDRLREERHELFGLLEEERERIIAFVPSPPVSLDDIVSDKPQIADPYAMDWS